MKTTSEKQLKSSFSTVLLSFWYGAAGWFTVLALGILLLGIVVGEEKSNATVEIRRFLLLFPCGCGLSAAQLIRRTRLSSILRLFLHYFITLLSLFLFLWLPTGNATFSKSLVAILLITVLYAVIRTAIYLIASAVKKKREKI